MFDLVGHFSGEVTNNPSNQSTTIPNTLSVQKSASISASDKGGVQPQSPGIDHTESNGMIFDL